MVIESEDDSNTADFSIGKYSSPNVNIPRFTFSMRSNNQDWWLYRSDGAGTYKYWLKFDYSANTTELPSGMIIISANGSSGGLRIGSDVYLYRDSTATARLQNSLIIDQYLYTGADILATGSVIAGSTGNNNVSMLWNSGHGYLTAHTGYLYLTAAGGRIYANDELIVETPEDTSAYGPLYLSESNSIGYDTSTLRRKKNVEDIEDCSWIYDLRPVTFDWKDSKRQEAEGRRMGLIAEEVNEIAPQLVWLDKEGLPEGVHYEWLGIPLLVEVKKLRARVEQLEQQLA